MKIMIRRGAEGQLSAYVPKKDLEEPIVSMEKTDLWGGKITLGNGWELGLPADGGRYDAADHGRSQTPERRLTPKGTPCRLPRRKSIRSKYC